MSKSISISLVLALAALALFVAGCGGGDDEATGSAKSDVSSESGPPSKAEFVKQAELVCTKYNNARFNEARRYRGQHHKELESLSPIPAEEKIILAVILPSILREAEDLDALDPPKGDEKTVNEIVTGLEAGVERAKKNPYAIELEEPSEYPFRKVGELIRDYGLVACRNPG